MSASTFLLYVVHELLELSIKAGDTVSDIARKSGYDRTHVYNVIGGRRLPSVEFLNAWAEIYDKKVIVIVTDDAIGGGLISNGDGSDRKN